MPRGQGCPRSFMNWPLRLVVFAQKSLASLRLSRKHREDSNRVIRAKMKAKIVITPKKAVLDPQGKAVQNALEQMGYSGIQAVHVGKYLEVELTGDKESARKQIDDACHKLLSNPVIEDYQFQIE